jgi:ribosomal protein L20
LARLNIELDRKILADLAVQSPYTFMALTEKVKALKA